MPENHMKHRCRNCSQPALRIKTNYLFRESGLSNVVLKNVDIVRCDKCGNQDPIIPRLTEILKALASAIIEKRCPLVGEEVRFLRKRMGMNGETFAQYLGVDKTTLSKWENSQIPIGTNSDRLIRAVVLALGPDSKPEIEKAVRNFPSISDEREPVRLELDVKDLTVHYASKS